MIRLFVTPCLVVALNSGLAFADSDKPRPFVIDAGYTLDAWNNSGGLKDGTEFLDNLSVGIETDFDALLGWSGVTARASVLYNNGSSLSDLTGDSMVVSNIETGVEAFRLYEAWVEVPFGNKADLKLGQYDLNSEFDVLETSSLFVGSAHGIGMDIAQTGENGPSIFPVTGLSARLNWNFSDEVSLRTAILDAVPGDIEDPTSNRLNVRSEEGVLAISELDVSVGDTKFLVGAWRYSEQFSRFDERGTDPNWGMYLRGESIFKTFENGVLRGFGRIGTASGEVNQYSLFASSGLTYELNQGGQFGIAVAHAEVSNDWQRQNPSSSSAETVFELTYANSIAEFLEIQPNIQYVSTPSANNEVEDALAIGVRFSLGIETN